MRFASLGSGSQGNSLVVEVKQTRLLLDCGFGISETAARLARLDLSPPDLAGILVTHEHDDHICGVAKLARKFNLPVWLSPGTLKSAGRAFAAIAQVFTVDIHARFAVGDIEIEPYPVPHDAREPAQYVFGDGAVKLGVLTDAGCSTPHIEQVLNKVHALVLECNHDADLLRASAYPETLKQRIAGRFGHLENAVAARLLAQLDGSRLQHLVAAHLSKQNNTPELARAALSAAVHCDPGWITVADQENGFSWREIL